jgi:hypothetical protein
VRVLGLCIASFLLIACGSAGQYGSGRRAGGNVDRGETNGRMFDFVSNMPEGDDWQIRIRDNSLWAAYGDGDTVADLGTANMSGKDTDKLWELVETVDLPGRKKGTPDEDEGWVELRLREPSGEETHDIIKIFVSRAAAGDDEAVLALAAHLQKLVEKYFKKKPEF